MYAHLWLQYMSCIFTLAVMAGIHWSMKYDPHPLNPTSRGPPAHCIFPIMYALIEGQCWNAQTNDSLDDPTCLLQDLHTSIHRASHGLWGRAESIPKFSQMTRTWHMLNTPETTTKQSTKQTKTEQTNQQTTKTHTKPNKNQPQNKKQSNKQPNQKGSYFSPKAIPRQVSPPPRVASAQNLVRISRNGIFLSTPKQEQSQMKVYRDSQLKMK